uniref:Uncharacterized protein n=1 Tax=Acrobeloides nanus TaxID=290746 RepID=A0A914CXH9_9BILA
MICQPNVRYLKALVKKPST